MMLLKVYFFNGGWSYGMAVDFDKLWQQTSILTGSQAFQIISKYRCHRKIKPLWKEPLMIHQRLHEIVLEEELGSPVTCSPLVPLGIASYAAFTHLSINLSLLRGLASA